MSITLKQVSYTYAQNTSQKTDALKDISLTVNDGEFIGIMGHTGCGKTTLFQLIAGLITPASGQVLLDGSDINDRHYDRRLLRKKVGLVFQHPEYQLFESTVERDVAFALKHSNLNKAEIDARVEEALTLMGFSYEDIRGESPLALSGGEKRRVAIAGVLAAKPEILIFDEPIAGLDADGRKEFMNLVTELNRAGATILMVSHNADVLCEYAERILVFEHGRLVLDGSPASVFADIERTKKLNINASQPRLIADMLIREGLCLSPDITSYNELLCGLKQALKGGDFFE